VDGHGKLVLHSLRDLLCGPLTEKLRYAFNPVRAFRPNSRTETYRKLKSVKVLSENLGKLAQSNVFATASPAKLRNSKGQS